jgi:diguanylate cyclase (GGDEF)-like protein
VKEDGPDSRVAILIRLGRERDFPAERFRKLLAQAAPREQRSELLARLITDWTGLHLPPPEAAGIWTEIERLLPVLRGRLGAPLGLQTVLLHYLHGISGLLEEPRIVSDRELSILRVNALTDPLTGLYNRRFLLDHLEREISRAERSQSVVSVVLIDLKGFKAVNDRFGHPVGDSVLVRTAKVIRQSLRAVDAGARWGGDEFVLVLPNTDLLSALAVAERVRRKVAAIGFPRGLFRIGMHYGSASYPADGKTVDFLVKVADLRLYQCREQSHFGGQERRRHPRFSPDQSDLRVQWRVDDRSCTASVLDVSHSGLALRTERPLATPERWTAQIVHRRAAERRAVELRTLNTAPLPDGGLRVGCAYSGAHAS